MGGRGGLWAFKPMDYTHLTPRTDDKLVSGQLSDLPRIIHAVIADHGTLQHPPCCCLIFETSKRRDACASALSDPSWRLSGSGGLCPVGLSFVRAPASLFCTLLLSLFCYISKFQGSLKCLCV